MHFTHTIMIGLSVLSICRSAPIDVSTNPPGGLEPEEVPQLIFVTFDDSTTTPMYEGVQKISGHTNPDGSPIAFTFYVSLDAPDFYNAHKLHAEGHEIAAHTVTHTTGNESTLEEWAREIASCKEGLVRFAQIPADEIRGFRAPFLAYNQHTFNVLHDMGFEYDTSIPESANGIHSGGPAAFIWPYHLHDGLKQIPHTGTAPNEPLPGLMEIPMWQLQKIGGGEHNMDPAEPSKQAMLDMLKHNFTTRYEGNRVPVAIWNHVGWLENQNNVDALNEFFTWALAHEDVWVVPVIKMVDWMQNPLPVSDPAHTGILSVATREPLPESEVRTNIFNNGTAYIRSVGSILPAVPDPSSLFMELQPIDANVEFELITTDDQWGSFGLKLVATNSSSHEFERWEIKLETGDVTIQEQWNLNHKPNEDGTLTIKSKGDPSTIIHAEANQQVLMDVWVTGSSDDLEIISNTILGPKFSKPVLKTSTSGNLDWDHTAPIYEVQKRSGLTEGDWVTIRTQYGVSGMEIVEEEDPTSFYRVKAIP